MIILQKSEKKWTRSRSSLVMSGVVTNRYKWSYNPTYNWLMGPLGRDFTVTCHRFGAVLGPRSAAAIAILIAIL